MRRSLVNPILPPSQANKNCMSTAISLSRLCYDGLVAEEGKRG
jgi:hypothetical protein